MPSIPLTFNEVTPQWLGEVLDTYVVNFESQKIGEGVGLMGDIYRVELDYASNESGLPPSVVVKLPSSFEENRQQGVALGLSLIHI